MGWSVEELPAELLRYEAACELSGLAPASVHSYVDYPRRFLRWRVGDYRPRSAFGPGPTRPLAPADANDLLRELDAYEADLRAAELRPQAVQTYVIHARHFVLWLAGRFEPGATLSGARGSRRAPSPSVPAQRATPTRIPVTEKADGWSKESNVQAAMVGWLVASGWRIDRVADTESREHGVDVIARRDGRRLALEVKGYPQPTYERGDRAGQPKRWHPAGQARTYFGTALHTVMATRDAMPDVDVGLVFPDVTTYRNLVAGAKASLDRLGIRVYFVNQAGTVTQASTEPDIAKES